MFAYNIVVAPAVVAVVEGALCAVTIASVLLVRACWVPVEDFKRFFITVEYFPR